MKRTLVVLLTVLLFSATGVYAELHDRGGGLIYDDVLDVTWLQDANYAYTSRYDDDGKMTWAEAMVWADQLEYGGYKDWRLPKTLPINGESYNHNHSYDGTTDYSWNITSPNSELPYLFYVGLGNTGWYDTNGNETYRFELYDAPVEFPGPFINIQPNFYWPSTDYDDSDNLLTFHFDRGIQDHGRDFIEGYAWAVRDGDVASLKCDLKGREYFPGITIGLTTFGARFAGQLLNAAGEPIGHFDTVLNHQGGPIEQCGATNTIVYFKLKMNFFDGRRLVLVMPYGDTATADWDWDDPECPYGGRNCDFYSVEDRVPCGSDVNPDVSLVAEVSTIPLTKRQFGSRGFDEISGGILYGWLIHTPPIFPAVIGTFVGN
jgi:hypothetical protein